MALPKKYFKEKSDRYNTYFRYLYDNDFIWKKRISIKESAELTGFREKKIKGFIQLGVIPYNNDENGDVYFIEVDLIRWLIIQHNIMPLSL